MTDAHFKYGTDSLNSYLSQIHLSPELRETLTTGMVQMTAKCDTSGNLFDYEVIQGLGEAMNIKVFKAIQQTSGEWTPAARNGFPQIGQVEFKVEFRMVRLDYAGQAAPAINEDHPVVVQYMIPLVSTDDRVRGRLPMSAYDSNQEAYFAYGMEHFERGEYSMAIKKFKQVLALNGENSDALYHRGICWRELGFKSKCCKDMKKASALEHEAASAYLAENCK